MVSKVIVTLLFILTGFGMLVYSKKVKDFTGSWAWAEQYFGLGGTYTGIKLIGLGCIIFAFMYATGSIQEILLAVLGPFFGTDAGSAK